MLAQLEADQARADAATLARIDATGEAWPDGSYGGTRRRQPDPQAADHAQDLLDGLAGWRLGDRAKHPWPPTA